MVWGMRGALLGPSFVIRCDGEGVGSVLHRVGFCGGADFAERNTRLQSEEHQAPRSTSFVP